MRATSRPSSAVWRANLRHRWPPARPRAGSGPGTTRSRRRCDVTVRPTLRTRTERCSSRRERTPGRPGLGTRSRCRCRIGPLRRRSWPRTRWANARSPRAVADQVAQDATSGNNRWSWRVGDRRWRFRPTPTPSTRSGCRAPSAARPGATRDPPTAFRRPSRARRGGCRSRAATARAQASCSRLRSRGPAVSATDDEMVGVTTTNRRRLTAGLESFLGVLADRLQQPIPQMAGLVGVGDDERLVDQLAQHVDDIERVEIVAAENALRPLAGHSRPRTPRGGSTPAFARRRAGHRTSRWCCAASDGAPTHARLPRVRSLKR